MEEATMSLKKDYSDQIEHKELKNWVQGLVEHCEPENVYWCDGSQEEYQALCELLVSKGTFIKLNEEKRP
ncbi:MAG: phosphoenolpyruvate carboxykinase, partial [Bacteroidota bacterium]